MGGARVFLEFIVLELQYALLESSKRRVLRKRKVITIEHTCKTVLGQIERQKPLQLLIVSQFGGKVERSQLRDAVPVVIAVWTRASLFTN